MDMPARYVEDSGRGGVLCTLCPHRCRIGPEESGQCRERVNRGGRLLAAGYGKVSFAAVDALQRRGLFHFLPGRNALSIGAAGCNMTCAYCLNWRVSQESPPHEEMTPDEVVERALAAEVPAIAFTYNEPVIGIEFVLDVARAARAAGLAVVLKTNGYIEPEPLEDLLGAVDALNVDLKGGDEGFYRAVCGARMDPVLRTLERSARRVHLEVTYLVIPGRNDGDEALVGTADWLAGSLGRGVPVHLLAYFPRWRMSEPPTPVSTLVRAREIFQVRLDHVYLGNDYIPGARDTRCTGCGQTLIRRGPGDGVVASGLGDAGACRVCGAPSGVVVDATRRTPAGPGVRRRYR